MNTFVLPRAATALPLLGYYYFHLLAISARRSLTARLHDCSTTAGSPCPGLPPGASRPQPVSLSHTRPCTPHDATGHAQHGCRLRRLRTATPLSTVYHGGWSNAPPRQAGSARRDNPLQAYSPKFTLASRSVGCAISQNMASSTAWKASRTTCALGGVSRFKGKLAPATVGSAGVSYSPSRILSGHRRFGEGRRYRASVHRYSRE